MTKFTAALVGALMLSTSAHAIPVGLELLLLTDVSGSVDNDEYLLQRNGYVNAFTSASVQNAIIGSVGGGIAVTYIEWSGGGQQSVKVGWTLINDAASANAFAALLAGTSRSFSGSTAPGSAINFATPLFASNDFEAPRQVIDVSGDGDQNDGADTSDARDAALLAGVDTINGLPIGGGASLLAFYVNNIQAGANGFTLPADTFADFNAAIRNKLIREITETPEPAALALFGLGILALGIARRRR